MTGKQSREDLAAQREWAAARERFNNDKVRYGSRNGESWQAWKRRIQNTRSA